MKRFLCIVLTIALIMSAFGTTVLANDDIISSKEDDGNDYISEEKIICNANINEDFKPDSIVVVLNNSKSRELNEYSATDFSDVSAVSVENLSIYTTEKLKQQRANVNSLENVTKKTLADVDEFYIDEETYHQFWLIKLSKSSKQNVLKCIKILEKRDDILLASPNYYTKPCGTVDEIATTNDEVYTSSYPTATPNDEDLGTQWAISKINLPAAWNISTGSSSVKVGIIDSGIQGSHPDLKNRVNRTLSKDFTGGNSPLTDPLGHGTHVAGIIGAQGNNSEGIAGVCWNVSLVSLKAAEYDSIEKDYVVTYSRFVEAMEYAQANSIPIVSISYAGEGSSSVYTSKIANYTGLFVCSAGNDGVEINSANPYIYSSSNTDNMISVANSNSSDVLASDSNYSPKYVDLAAPGTSIYSTYIGSTYKSLSGTSMAAPYVAGVAALLKSKYPAMTTKGLKHYILAGVDTDTSFTNKVETGGRLNAYNSLNKVKQYTVKYDKNGGTGLWRTLL